MSQPVALTHADIRAAQQAHNDAIAGVTASNQQVNNRIGGDLMARARGDYAVAINQLMQANDQSTQRALRDFQGMNDVLGNTSTQQGSVDADASSSFQRLLSFLNTK